MCKVIATTLTKYKDPASQQLVNNLILELMKNHSDLALENFNAVFKALSTKELANAPPAKAAPAAVIALVWTNTVGANCDRESDVGKAEFNKLVEYQSLLYSLAVQSKNEKISEKAFSFLKDYWQKIHENVEELYFVRFLAMEPAYNVIAFLAALLNYFQDPTLFDQNREKLIDHFVKGLVTVKVKPSVNYIKACKIILNSVTKDEFKASIQPALQRSMLRNPEIILEGVGLIVSELNIDISEFSVDLGKILIQNLYSKNDQSRLESVDSLKEISKKCSDIKVIETLLTQIFSVLGGSDGKITVAEYRINLLQVSLNFLCPALENPLKHFYSRELVI